MLLFFIFFLNSFLLFCDDDVLLKTTITRMFKEYFNFGFDEKEIVFNNIIDTSNKWSCNFTYLQSEYSILIDNMNLQVVLEFNNQKYILYKEDINKINKLSLKQLDN